jgi:uncharacterized protein YciI
MGYYAAFLREQDPEKSKKYRDQHMAFLAKKGDEGKIFARGRFNDGTGGLVIYIANSLEEARKLAQEDPYISTGARTLDLHEWNMQTQSK